jgi:hypothetical protein
MDTTQLKRIADAMEEILRLVKEDQAQYKKKSKDEEEQSWPTGLGKEENAKEKN